MKNPASRTPAIASADRSATAEPAVLAPETQSSPLGMDRRRFLQTGAAALAGGFALLRSGDSRATDAPKWGDYPDEFKGFQLPTQLQAKRVLEVFVLGGLCPWETFYASDDPAYGQKTGSQWWTFQQGADNIPTLAAQVPQCKGPALVDFAVDSLGHPVKFGILAEPLRSRTDIVGRMRLHVLSHGVYPHPFARPLAATGLSGGSPRLAGLGTAISHYQLEHSPGVIGAAAYVLTEGPTLLPGASRVGMHPVGARPLELRVDGNPSALFQTIVPEPAPVHQLSQAMGASFLARHTWPGKYGHVRSASLANLDSIDTQLGGLKELGLVLSPSDFVSPPGSSLYGAFAYDLTQTKLKLAAKILNNTAGAAKHVTVVDTGYSAGADFFGVQGYDFHTAYAKKAVDRYPMLWQRLCNIINSPGEFDPNKLDLADTLVVINSEFGRSPLPQDYQLGRNHHPNAYVTAMFGGPVGTKQKGIVGAIDANSLPVNPLTPAETRMATLVALGIYPFSKETFEFTDVPGAKTVQEALIKLNQVVLGVQA